MDEDIGIVSRSEVAQWAHHAVFQAIAEAGGCSPLAIQLDGDSTLEHFLSAAGHTRNSGIAGGAAERLLQQRRRWFDANWRILHHCVLDGGDFCATVFAGKDASRREYAISFRSDEFLRRSDGSRWRPGPEQASAWTLRTSGFALSQLSAMRRFFSELTAARVFDARSGAWVDSGDEGLKRFASDWQDGSVCLTATGYGLGAHLATAFAVLHGPRLRQAYTFNSPGIGGFTSAHGSVFAPDARALDEHIQCFEVMMAWDGDRQVPWFRELTARAQQTPKPLAAKLAKYVAACQSAPSAAASTSTGSGYRARAEATIELLASASGSVGPATSEMVPVGGESDSVRRRQSGFDYGFVAPQEWSDKLTQLHCHPSCFRLGVARAEPGMAPDLVKPTGPAHGKKAG